MSNIQGLVKHLLISYDQLGGLPTTGISVRHGKTHPTAPNIAYVRSNVSAVICWHHNTSEQDIGSALIQDLQAGVFDNYSGPLQIDYRTDVSAEETWQEPDDPNNPNTHSLQQILQGFKDAEKTFVGARLGHNWNESNFDALLYIQGKSATLTLKPIGNSHIFVPFLGEQGEIFDTRYLVLTPRG